MTRAIKYRNSGDALLAGLNRITTKTISFKEGDTRMDKKLKCLETFDDELIEDLYEALERTIYHPIFGTTDRAKEREVWQYEKAQGREEADDRIRALDALDKADMQELEDFNEQVEHAPDEES